MKLRSLILSRQAYASLADIGEWTVLNFGAQQAKRYTDQLVAQCKAIVRGRAVSQSCRTMFADDLAADLRFTRAGQHFVIFVEAPDEVLIVDFLHQSADIAGRLT